MSERGSPAERGAGSVLALGIIGAVVVVALLAVALGAGLAVRQRAIGAADNAAIAAADVARGLAPGAPCPAAERVARAHGAGLERCEIDGYVATVEVATTALGIRIAARATAGPPP